jgi:hypothetical protein
MASETHAAVLNPAQIRALSVTLWRVDMGLDEIEELLAEPTSGATYRFDENLTEEQRGMIRHLCRRLRAAVKVCNWTVRNGPSRERSGGKPTCSGRPCATPRASRSMGMAR